MNFLEKIPEDEKAYPWYKTIEGDSLYQGDLLHSFEVLIPDTASHGDQVSAQYKVLDVVIMTQTCDIVQGKVESLLLCPCWNLWQFVDEAKKKVLFGGKINAKLLDAETFLAII